MIGSRKNSTERLSETKTSIKKRVPIFFKDATPRLKQLHELGTQREASRKRVSKSREPKPCLLSEKNDNHYAGHLTKQLILTYRMVVRDNRQYEKELFSRD